MFWRKSADKLTVNRGCESGVWVCARGHSIRTSALTALLLMNQETIMETVTSSFLVPCSMFGVPLSLVPTGSDISLR